MNQSTRFSELSNEQLRSIHTTCETFENELRGTGSPCIEDHVEAAPEAIRKPLFRELLAIELELRTSPDDAPNIAEYDARFPHYEDEIRRVFLEMVESLVDDDQRSIGSEALPPVVSDPPKRIGRYRIESVLGQGGFGLVYRARDENLDRAVAIKVPHANIVSRPEDAKAYLAEARTVANLDHSNIVSVHDVGSNDEFPCYIVSKFVEGETLSAKLKTKRPHYRASAELVATLADALHYAHRQGLVHRDVKPGNILIGNDKKPFLMDFGLALREENIGKGPRYAGTPAYMSPEQARGEGHRVDGRSDIFSLGVVFYELLVGRPPFRGNTQAELLEQVTTYDPRPVRQHDERIPQELERICFKALSKRASHRYSSAHDMAADLRQFLADDSQGKSSDSSSTGTAASAANTTVPPASLTSVDSSSAGGASTGPGSDSRPITIIPKGLRSFDEEDADFFVELLPGPRDRNGLPDSLRFWKTRIEHKEADKTFSVGLIYGPSGCGKSSFVKAGLLPLLSKHVVPVYVEATALETESRLLNSLRSCCPHLRQELDLTRTLAAIRQGQGIEAGNKLLIVIDQFEQWLHAKREEENTELLEALRQCDGCQVQCIVTVRDDFWLAVSRFMHELEVDLVPGRNISLVDLFDLDHARRVLRAFGRAYGRLPETTSEISAEQKVFLKQAIAGLAEEGKVVCIRLALFAEMMKAKDWTPALLKDVGGTKGVGVTFLEETFSGPTANPTHRMHQRAARAVLKALLPESGIDIKGQMRSYAELLEASGYADRPKDFDESVRILDSEIRLITPTEADFEAGNGWRRAREESDDSAKASMPATHNPPPTNRFYQLTHDYLVHSLRQWLTQKQKETRRGRAELRLAERSAMWQNKPENRNLPSVWEWGAIRTLTDKKSWTSTHRQMMQKADRVNGLRWGIGLAAVLVIAITMQQLTSATRHRHMAEQTHTAVETVANSHGAIVPYAIEDLEDYPSAMVVKELQAQFADSKESQKLALACALAHFGSVYVDFLVDRIEDAPASEAANIADALANSKEDSLTSLQRAAAASETKSDWRLKHQLAVVALYLGDTSLARDMCELKPDRKERLYFIIGWTAWHGDISRLAETAPTWQDSALRSGICAGIGGMRSENVTAEVKHAWNPVLFEWNQNSPDAAVHNAAGWVLRQWKLKTPALSSSKGPKVGHDWYVNSAGMTMIKIPAGSFTRRFASNPTGAAFLEAPLQKVTLTRSFLLSDREVSVGQFQQMIDDPDYPDKEKRHWLRPDPVHSPTDDHPVQNTNWNDAVLYCNWLSHKEGLSPCYERTGHIWKIPTGEFEEWRLVSGTDGYRLPTEAEWEHACRAGIATQDPFGDEVNSLLLSVFTSGRQRIVSLYVQGFKPEICGAKAPNGWGLFDLHGNVREWCHDWWRIHHHAAPKAVVDPMGPPENDGRLRRVFRDGIFNRVGIALSEGSPNIGFRVVRTIEE